MYMNIKIDDFLKPQKYIKHDEQEVDLNYDFTNGTPSNFIGLAPLEEALLKINWNDYHLKCINFNNVFLKKSIYNLLTKNRLEIQQRFDIKLTIRNDARKDPTRFISIFIWQARGERHDHYQHKQWEYNNAEEYVKAIKTALNKLYAILADEEIKLL